MSLFTEIKRTVSDSLKESALSRSLSERGGLRPVPSFNDFNSSVCLSDHSSEEEYHRFPTRQAFSRRSLPLSVEGKFSEQAGLGSEANLGPTTPNLPPPAAATAAGAAKPWTIPPREGFNPSAARAKQTKVCGMDMWEYCDLIRSL